MGTPDDLIEAALGARIATRAAVAGGGTDEVIRRQVILRYRAEMEAERFGPSADEKFIAKAQEAVESVLAPPPDLNGGTPRPIAGHSHRGGMAEAPEVALVMGDDDDASRSPAVVPRPGRAVIEGPGRGEPRFFLRRCVHRSA